MSHPQWCGGYCSECKGCDLERSMPCFPSCEGFDPVTGEHTHVCKNCDAINDI